MPDSLSKPIQELRNRAELFCSQVLAPLESTLSGDVVPSDLRDRVIAASKDAGFYSMTQPEAYSGEEVSAVALTTIREAIAASNLLLAHHVFAPSAGVLASATGRLREDYLDPLMRGEKRGSFGFTEPEDAPRPTWATRDGDNLVVTGLKSYVTGGADADFVAALINVEASDGRPGGTALAVIDLNAPGVTIERTFHSLDGSHHAAVRFENVRIPDWHIVGNVGEGMPRALADISRMRLALSAQACGAMQWAIGAVTEHLNAPHRSGTSLAAREGVRLRYADLRIEAYAARSMLYRTARLVDSDANDVNEVMCTKVYCTEAAGRIVDAAVQLSGGDALTAGHPLERLYREVRSWRFAEGASDVLRLNIARGKLELDKGTL